jgi:predicted AAA+ superfamily ATPase
VTQRIHGSNEGRELGGLMEAMDRYDLQEGIILTEDTEDVFDKDGRKIIVKPVWKWLLE